MRRAAFAASFLFVAGCVLPAEERLPVQPLRENGLTTYADVVTRARLQAGSATEAFYINKWGDLEAAAHHLDQSARLLVKASDVPVQQKDRLVANADELARAATDLGKAAKAQNVKQVNELLQKIHLKVRELRPEG